MRYVSEFVLAYYILSYSIYYGITASPLMSLESLSIEDGIQQERL